MKDDDVLESIGVLEQCPPSRAWFMDLRHDFICRFWVKSCEP